MKITISHGQETFLCFETESKKDVKSLQAFENELIKDNHRYGSVAVDNKILQLAIPCSLFYRRNGLTSS